MSQAAFRFLQASDFRLDAPQFGVADLPGPLRDLLIDARYRAAARVFDVALRERVDFVVIAGGLLDRAGYGIRGAVFFAEQAARLAARGIPIFWAEPGRASTAWPDFVPLPPNVIRANAEIGHESLLSAGGSRRVRIAACRHGRLRGAAATTGTFPFTIGVAPSVGVDGTFSPTVDYWALGGRTQAQPWRTSHGPAQFSGSPQGRTLHEPGSHGCLVVDVSTTNRVRTRFVATDVVRWQEETIEIPQDARPEAVRAEIDNRIRTLGQSTTAEAIFVRWVLTGQGAAFTPWLDDELCHQTRQALRLAHGEGQPAVWSLAVDAVPSEAQQTLWRTGADRAAALVRVLDEMESRDEAIAVNDRAVAAEPTAGESSSGPRSPHFLARVRSRAVQHGVHLLTER